MTSQPAGIACGADCSENFAHSLVVTLTATPQGGSAFGGWSGACAASATLTCTLTMEAALGATATFLNTAAGAGVTAIPVDTATGTSPISITFANVTQSGDTTLTISPASGRRPDASGFRFGDPPLIYDISTNAEFAGTATVCIDYMGMTFGGATPVGLYHFENGLSVDRTVSIDQTNHIVCGEVTSFSPFAVGEPIDAAPPVVHVPANLTREATSAARRRVVHGVGSRRGVGRRNADVRTGIRHNVAIGTTTVVCSATDPAGNTGSASFSITVSDVTTPGDMRGDGFIRQNAARYQFEFRVVERASTDERGRLRLTINHDAKKKKDDVFVAREVAFVAFSDDPTRRPGRRQRPQIDTVTLSGTGSWNGQAGYRYEVRAADEGEPGRHRESVTIVVTSPSGTVVATVSGTLTGGNVQSRRIRH